MSAFFLFSQAERPNVKVEFPEATFGEVVSWKKHRNSDSANPFTVLCIFGVYELLVEGLGVRLAPYVTAHDGATYRRGYYPMYGRRHVCGTVFVVPTT